MPVTARGPQKSLSGTLATLTIFDLITGSANFAVSEQLVDVDFDGSNTTSTDRVHRLDDAKLVTFALSDLQLAIGTTSAGVTITGGNIGIASIAAPLPPANATYTDTRKWTALSASSLTVTLTLPGVTAQITDASLLLNTATGAYDPTGGDPADAIQAAALLWATDEATPHGLTVDLNADNGFVTASLVNPGAALPSPVAMPVTVRGPITAFAGTLSNLDIFGVVTGSAKFALTKKLVDVDLDGNGTTTTNDQLNDATLLLFGLSDLNLNVGTAGAGIEISDGKLGIAVLNAPAPLTGTDTRSWLAITARDLDVTVDLPGIDADFDNVTLAINKAAGAAGSTLATPLNWATDETTPHGLTVDLDPTNGWTTPQALVDPGTATAPMPITLRGELLSVGGELTDLNLFGFIRGGAKFEITSGTIAVDLPANDPVTPTLLRLGLRDAHLTIGDVDGMYFEITGASLALAIINAGAPATPATDNRSWLALKGSIGTASVHGFPSEVGLTVRNLDVEVNRASGFYDPTGGTNTDAVAATPLNWLTQLNLDKDGTAGEATDDRLVIGGKTIDFTAPFLRAAGRVDVNLFGMVNGSMAFAFEQRTVDVNLGDVAYSVTPGGDLADATLTTLGLEILGDDGNPANGVENGLFIGAPDRSIGFSVGSGSLAIAMVAPSTAAKAAGDNRSWTAITAKIQTGTFLPADGPFKATVNSLGIEINQATNTTPLNWLTAIDLGADAPPFTAQTVTITVPTGGTPIEHKVEYTGQRLRATGDITVDIFGFVTGRVTFSFETKTVDVDLDGGGFDPTGGVDLDNATLTLISLAVPATPGIFVGVPNGPGFSIKGGTLSVATIKPAGTGDTRSWLAVTAELDDGSLTGIDQVQLDISDVSLTLNKGPVNGTPLNWKTAIVGGPVSVVDANGTATPIELMGDQLALSAHAEFNFFTFVSGEAQLDFALKTVNATVNGAPLNNARLTTFALTIEDLFIGANDVGFSLDDEVEGG
jgi:hypothetical protein